MTIDQMLLLSVIAVAAGIFGAILGLGGGVIITPVLTLLFGVDIKYAIGASIISVIATSSGSAMAYVKDEITNTRAALFLEIATTVGAILGAILGSFFAPKMMFILFGSFLSYSAYNMIKNRRQQIIEVKTAHPWANYLKLNNSYYDKALKQQIDYKVQNVPAGFAVMAGAGFASGLLGIGSGVFKVMALDSFMKLPLKVSSATSNLMMGVTAAASATIYLFNGAIQPSIAAPVALGVVFGAKLGAKIMQHLKPTVIRYLSIPLIVVVAIQMILKGLGIL